MEAGLCQVFGRESYLPEFRFHPDRKWRFDYAIPVKKIAIEIEGGIWTNGRHTRGKGYQGDLDKYNTASANGWRVLRFSTQDVLSGRFVEFVRLAADDTD